VPPVRAAREDALRPYLRMVDKAPPGVLILVDDIITTGGSLMAAYNVLSEGGAAPAYAIVCGHTVSDSLLSAFGPHTKTVDTEERPIEF
jgi:phosphoribosylpyrophosphate synthetase